MRYRMKLWAGLGAFALVQSTLVDPVSLLAGGTPVAHAQTAGGEAGAGGEGGEGGVDIEAARTDPVAYITALDVVRAHYLAGWLAYEAGDKTAGQEMFVHPISEVYVDMEPVFESRGVAPFGKAMEEAGELAGQGAPAGQVRAAVDKVLAALEAAEAKAPEKGEPMVVRARVLSEFFDRAVQQYKSAADAKNEEPYLDGVGLYLVARERANRDLAAIEKRSADAGKAVRDMLGLLEKAYPGAKRPAKPGAEMADMLLALSRAELALSSL